MKDKYHIESGADKFGTYSVWVCLKREKCDCCENEVKVIVRYFSPKFGKGIQLGDRRLIIKTPRAKMCLTCFGKLHRQVVHIQEGVKNRG